MGRMAAVGLALVAAAISLVVGILAARSDRIFRWSIALSGFLYTIPTLAFLALLIPVVGLGRTNAIICMVAFSLMMFYAFAMQCASTVAVVYRETKSWRWPAVQFAYMTVLAYAASFVAYHLLR